MVWWIDGILPEGTGKWLAPPGFYPTGQWRWDINKPLTTYSAGSSRSGLNSEAGTSSQMWRIDWINMNRSPWNIYRIYSLQMSTVVRNHYDCDPMISQIVQHFTWSGWPDGQGGSNPGIDPKRNLSFELPKRDLPLPKQPKTAKFHGTCWENCVLYDLFGFHPSW